MKRFKNIILGIFWIVFGVYFVNLCIGNLNKMGWGILDPSEQVRTLRHPYGEDWVQLMFSIICGAGGILGGIFYLSCAIFSKNTKQITNKNNKI